MATIKEALAAARAYLNEKGIKGAALDAEVLLMHCTGLDRVALLRDDHHVLTPDQETAFGRLLERRGRAEPIAYLIGRREFMGLDFAVDPRVLIPRPETEMMVERVLGFSNKKIIIDVGTGSGAVAVSLATFLPDTQIYATDISAQALEVAQKNASRHQVRERVAFCRGDLLEPLRGLGLEGRVDVVTANLPYVPTGELPELMPDVRLYEPALALDGGIDGLDLYRRLIPAAREFLAPRGHLLMEITPGQGDILLRLLSADGWQGQVEADLAGLERLVVARKP